VRQKLGRIIGIGKSKGKTNVVGPELLRPHSQRSSPNHCEDEVSSRFVVQPKNVFKGFQLTLVSSSLRRIFR
jgi:hypothetical protein